jgi:protein-L-isoaspartate(D-aspartate) O-methyltransferase
MIDFKLARETMVESQLRTAGVTDKPLLAAMGSLPREIFVAPENRSLAYMDGPVPIGPADPARLRYLMPAMVLARLLQAAEIGAHEKVLDIGCATGYSLAVLAALAAEVVGLESDPELASQARRNLTETGLVDASVLEGKLAEGAAAQGPYDLIFIDGSVPAIPSTLMGQLKQGGRIAAVITSGNQGVATLFVVAAGEFSPLPQFSAGAPLLPGFAREVSFNF